MSNYQRTIDQLRFQLESDNLELTDELERLGEEYAEACRLANARLRRCGDFLRKGLRSEAIHFAEASPNLLEFVGLLDFPEREQWDELVSLYQLPQPEPLQLELAEQLNEAYTAQQPIENLIDRHRLLALARAPLAKRMAILRGLAENDPDGTFWEEDLQTMEQARFREIASSAKAAARDGNGKLLDSLTAEITETPWREKLPKNLLSTVRRYANDQARGDALRTLQRIEQPLLDAFSALDLARARRLRDEWERAARIAKLEQDAPLMDHVGPALGWVADEEARENAERGFQNALAALERALEDDRTSLEELERLGHDVMKWDRNVPELTSHRYQNRLASLQLAGTRRHRLIMGGALVAICLVVGFVGLLGYRSLQATEVKRVATSIETMMKNGELRQARELVDQHRDFPALDPWLKVQASLAKAEGAEADRSSQFNALMQSISRENDHKTVMNLLGQAGALAKTPDEKLAIANLEREHQDLWRSFVSERESEIRESITSVMALLRDLDQQLEMLDSDDDRFDQLLTDASQQLVEAKRLAQSVDSPSAAQIGTLASRLDGLTQARVDILEKSRLLALLRDQSLINPRTSEGGARFSTFGKTLAMYAEKFPNDARSGDFAMVAEEAPLWQGEASWQELLTGWKQMMPSDLVEIRKRIHQCETFLKDHAGCPSVALASEYKAYLESIRNRYEDSEGDGSEGIQSQLLNLYSSDLIATAYVLKNKATGTRFYVPSDEDITGTNLASVQYYAGFNGDLKSETIEISDLTSRSPVLAPQAKIAKTFRAELPDVAPGEWQSFFKTYSARILQEPELDDFLRYFLLVRTLEYAAAGDWGLQRELEPYLQRLRDDRIDLAARWMAPNDPDTGKSRRFAQEALARLGDLASVWNAARERTGEIERQIFRTPRSIGYLLNEEPSVWTCHTEWSADRACSLAVIVPGTEGNPGKFQVIGRAGKDQLQIQSWIDPHHAREGRPVFAIVETMADSNTTTASRSTDRGLHGK